MDHIIGCGASSLDPFVIWVDSQGSRGDFDLCILFGLRDCAYLDRGMHLGISLRWAVFYLSKRALLHGICIGAENRKAFEARLHGTPTDSWPLPGPMTVNHLRGSLSSRFGQ